MQIFTPIFQNLWTKLYKNYKKVANMNDLLKERVRNVVTAKGIKAADLAREIGWEKSRLTAQLSGDRKITLGLIYDMVNRFPEISMEYIFHGKGPTLLDGSCGEAGDSYEQKLIAELKMQLREKDAQIDVLKSCVMNMHK